MIILLKNLIGRLLGGPGCEDNIKMGLVAVLVMNIPILLNRSNSLYI
jgi:hypothetical protein